MLGLWPGRPAGCCQLLKQRLFTPLQGDLSQWRHILSILVLPHSNAAAEFLSKFCKTYCYEKTGVV